MGCKLIHDSRQGFVDDAIKQGSPKATDPNNREPLLFDLSQAPFERRKRDPQFSRRSATITTVPLQHGDYIGPFQVTQRPRPARPTRILDSHFTGSVPHAVWHVFEMDLWPSGQDARLFDGVLEFAYVARPTVSKQGGQSVRAEPRDAAAQSACYRVQ
jgi:hypothetical protein